MTTEWNQLSEEKKSSEIGKQVRKTIDSLEDEYAAAYQKNRYESLIKFLDEKKTIPVTFDFDIVFLHLERIGYIKLSNQEKGVLLSNMSKELKIEAERHRSDRSKYYDMLNNSKDPKHLKYACRRKAVIEWAELYLKNVNL